MKRHFLWIFIIISILITVRYVDYSTVSVLINREFNILKNTKGCEFLNENEISYEYIGLSTHKKAFKRLKDIMKYEKNNSHKKIIIIQYFNFLNPSKYLIYNKGTRKSILLSIIDVVIDSGLTEVNLFKYDYLSINSNGQLYSKRDSIFGSWFDYFEKQITQNENHKILIIDDDKNIEHTYLIKNLFIFYFYIPLVIILYFNRKMNIQISFFYFFIMLLLFKPGDFFIGGFSFWMISSTDVSLIVKFIFILGLIFFISIVIQEIKKGLLLYMDKKLTIEEKYVTLVFLLSSIVLRF